MNKKQSKNGLKTSFICAAVIPLLIAGLIISSVGYGIQRKNIYNEINTELEYLADTVSNSIDSIYPGKYEIVKSDTLVALKKGDSFLTSDFVDKIKSDTGLEITLFFNDVRMITTICDENNRRILGTKMNSAIKKDVLEKKLSKFYDKINIGKEKYFAYYLPLYSEDGDVIGAISVLKHASEVNGIITNSVIPIFVIIGLSIALAVFFVIRYFAGVSKAFNNIGVFLHDVENGNLNAEMNQKVLSREDEIGDMAKSSVEMQKSIRSLVQKDALTKLYNRRFCNQRIQLIDKKNQENTEPYSICISDIDFFKKVNDTYGHDAGDKVLVAVANTLKNFMNGKGFAARWGGEEFLLVFERNTVQEAALLLNDLLDEIRAIEIKYNNQIIKVTMSAGVANAYGIEYEKAIKNADDRLYFAKTHGRNQVVSEM